MIEWVEAASGDKVIRCDGRLLASRYYPVQEAGDWFARRRSFVATVKTVFILGAGSGYHILEVAKNSTAQIVVVEMREDLIQAVKPLLSEVSERITFVQCNSAREIRSNERIRQGLQNSFVLLEHPASLQFDLDAYKEISTWLRARDWGPLNWQWKLKGFAPLDSQPKLLTSANPLTILDLDDCDAVNKGSDRERLFILALRELVK